VFGSVLADSSVPAAQALVNATYGAQVLIDSLDWRKPDQATSPQRVSYSFLRGGLCQQPVAVPGPARSLVFSEEALAERKMNHLKVGEVLIGTVRRIEPYGAFIDIGGVSGLLHISEISHEHIETPYTVLNVNDQIKVIIVDLDAAQGRISLSTKALEPEPGDMLTDPQKVFNMAEKMAARYKQTLQEQA